MARESVGSFIPTTQVWDVNEIYSTEVTSPAFKELLVRLYQNLNNQSVALNTKDTGYYDVTEFVNGQIFFPNPAYSSATQTKPAFRQVFRKVINFGALPNAGAKTAAHGITMTPGMTFTRIYGAASDTTHSPNFYYIPLPYVCIHVPNNSVEVNVNQTNVTIETLTNMTNYDTSYVVLEYLKQ